MSVEKAPTGARSDGEEEEEEDDDGDDDDSLHAWLSSGRSSLYNGCGSGEAPSRMGSLAASIAEGGEAQLQLGVALVAEVLAVSRLRLLLRLSLRLLLLLLLLLVLSSMPASSFVREERLAGEPAPALRLPPVLDDDAEEEEDEDEEEEEASRKDAPGLVGGGSISPMCSLNQAAEDTPPTEACTASTLRSPSRIAHVDADPRRVVADEEEEEKDGDVPLRLPPVHAVPAVAVAVESLTWPDK